MDICKIAHEYALWCKRYHSHVDIIMKMNLFLFVLFNCYIKGDVINGVFALNIKLCLQVNKNEIPNENIFSPQSI
jgi:hypothetical protein